MGFADALRPPPTARPTGNVLRSRA